MGDAAIAHDVVDTADELGVHVVIEQEDFGQTPFSAIC